MAALILSILLAALPSGRDAARRVETELARDVGAEKISVVIKGGATKGALWSAESVAVTLSGWETDSGRATSAKMVFISPRAKMEEGSWKLESCEKTTVEIRLNEDDLWTAAALRAGAAQLTSLEFSGDSKVLIKGTQQIYMGIALPFSVAGKAAVRNGSEIILAGPLETTVAGAKLGSRADSYVLRIVNPLADIDDWDVSSALLRMGASDAVGWMSMSLKSAKIRNGTLVVSGELKRR
jgi:hypothetical protein